MDSPLSLVGDGFAWYSIDGSLSEFRQIAHVSAHISHDHIATAFHFLISNRGAFGNEAFGAGFAGGGAAAASSMGTSTLALASAIVYSSVFRRDVSADGIVSRR